MVKIGLDLDGVTIDCSDRSEIRSRWARKLYGVDVPAEKFNKGYVIGNGHLTAEQYANLQDTIYNNREIGLEMRPVPGVLEFLPRLIAQGHGVRVITSREPVATAIAEEWLLNHNLHVEIIGVGQGVSKAEAVAGLEVFVDDEYHKLKNLIGIVAHRFLFTWPYNSRVETGYVARRVASWGELYYAIREIADKGGR